MENNLLLVGSGNAKRMRSFLRFIEPVNNRPVTTTNRDLAIRVSSETAEKIRFNLTARGYRVAVVA